MNQNLLKQKCELILKKELYIKSQNGNKTIITDENNTFEIILNNDNSVNLFNNYFENIDDFIVVFLKLNSEDQDEKYSAYVDLMNYDKRLKGDYHEIRELAKEGKYLDLLVNDKDYYVRLYIARQGYYLDKLINDENWQVRYEIAKQGYNFNKLIYDKDWHVREVVANHGYGLDVLINDEIWCVRVAVAKQNYGLNKLVNDKDSDVLCAVAEQGYGLDILMKSTVHRSTNIKNSCRNWLKSHNMTIRDYKKKLEENNGSYDWIINY